MRVRAAFPVRPALLTAAAILAMAGLRAQVVGTVSVSSGSMVPTVCPGDWLLVSKLDAGDRAAVGDLVVFAGPDDGEPAVKRVVALAGQRVEVRDAVLYVDREPVEESYVDRASVDGTFFGPTVVPAGRVFVLGDEREHSIDSRDYGAVERSRIEGEVVARLHSACGDYPRGVVARP